MLKFEEFRLLNKNALYAKAMEKCKGTDRAEMPMSIKCCLAELAFYTYDYENVFRLAAEVQIEHAEENDEWVFELLLLEANALLTTRRLAEGVEKIKFLKQLLEPTSFHALKAKTLLAEAKAHLILRNIAEAKIALGDDFVVSVIKHDEEVQAQHLRLQSKIAHLEGNIASSIVMLNTAAVIYNRIENFSESYYLHLELGSRYDESGDLNQAMGSFQQALSIAEQSGVNKLNALPLFNLGAIYQRIGDVSAALDFYKTCLSAAHEYGNPAFSASLYRNLAAAYLADSQFHEAWTYSEKRIQIYHHISNSEGVADALAQKAEILKAESRNAEALEVLQRAIGIASDNHFVNQQLLLTKLKAEIHLQTKDFDSAEDAFLEAFNLSEKTGFKRENELLECGLADCLLKKNKMDAAFLLLEKLMDKAQQNQNSDLLLRVSSLYSEAHEKSGNFQLALAYQRQVNFLEKQQLDKAVIRKLEATKHHQQIIQKERETEIERKRNEELNRAYTELNETHQQLKRTQEQLISQEKLASLGRLTAGIAHEIQNPLNFVNNFSELSAELVEEIEKDVPEEISDVMFDIKSNLTKISDYGRRASGIVKAMLELSRSADSAPTKVRLKEIIETQWQITYNAASNSFFKGKQCSFLLRNATEGYVITAPASSLAKLLQNVFDNALYATHEASVPTPEVEMEIQTNNTQLVLRIADNGTGLTEEVLDKMFEPFFTLKPTGAGNTGLGLAICRDIATAMGGKIYYQNRTDTKGAVAIIELPTTA